MKSGKETTASHKSLANTYYYTITVLARLGANIHPPRSGVRDLDLSMLIPASQNNEPAEFADKAGT